ncbi:hypothetical protein B0O99DRAFT_614414 [Bisporella sp. PMI_857]|nr:hypothetical protein B0O99DRAFT_614414 [Bisporella sp. PMI_857]
MFFRALVVNAGLESLTTLACSALSSCQCCSRVTLALPTFLLAHITKSVLIFCCCFCTNLPLCKIVIMLLNAFSLRLNIRFRFAHFYMAFHLI